MRADGKSEPDRQSRRQSAVATTIGLLKIRLNISLA